MTTFFTITIAATTLKVSSRDERIVVLPPAVPAYRQFTDQQVHVEPDIEVMVSTEPVPPSLLKECRRIFDGDGVWSLFRCGDDYLLSYNPFANTPPLWTIHCNRHFSRLTAYCDQWLIQETEGRRIVPSPITYPLDQVILIHHFARQGGLIVHSTGLEQSGGSSIFPGRSGAGKSSLAKILLEAEGVELLSDDRVVVRKQDDTFVAHGTPWPGEAQIAANRNSPLHNIIFLTHSPTNRVIPLTPQQALTRLFPVASMPWYDEEIIGNVMDFCGDLVKTIPAYELQFTLDKEVLAVLGKEIFASAQRTSATGQ